MEQQTYTAIPSLNITLPEFASGLICFSHLRWNFVFQRPQHLINRFTSLFPVYYFEEPVNETVEKPILRQETVSQNLLLLVPVLPHGYGEEESEQAQKYLLDAFITENNLANLIAWYYTPMALAFSSHLNFELVVFDAMDELSAFKFAPPRLLGLERQLLEKADVVFTGGRSIYEFKKGMHGNIHCFPSSIDKQHFGRARQSLPEPKDQAIFAGIKLGFIGVIDERFDTELLRQFATARPAFHFIIIGPTVKIDPATLPYLPNIHYMGQRSYNQMPAYMRYWDIALIPFALNESTRFISPTKTPEYLAAALPVIATPIADVVNPYGEENLVEIAENAAGFIKAADTLLAKNLEQQAAWLSRADYFLEPMSWDNTWMQMVHLMQHTLAKASV